MTPELLAALLDEIEEPEPLVDALWVFRHSVVAHTRRFAVGAIIEPDRAWCDRGDELLRWRGRPLREVVCEGLQATDPVHRAAAMACLNGSIREATSTWVGKATDPFQDAVRRERTCVIGHFDEAARWRDAGYPVTIVELVPQPGDVHWHDAGEVLASASLVFITGFTILNGTFREVIARTPQARLRVLMGPSVPGSATLLEHGVHVVGGSTVTDPELLLRYFQYGGTSVRKAPPGALRRFNIADVQAIARVLPTFGAP